MKMSKRTLITLAPNTAQPARHWQIGYSSGSDVNPVRHWGQPTGRAPANRLLLRQRALAGKARGTMASNGSRRPSTNHPTNLALMKRLLLLWRWCHISRRGTRLQYRCVYIAGVIEQYPKKRSWRKHQTSTQQSTYKPIILVKYHITISIRM